MGKTPKEKVNERRRPYNYLRNTQAQGHFSGNETRNYYYSSGSVQRPVAYHRLRPAAPNQFKRSPFRGELYRDRVSNIPKLGKPHLRKHLPNKKIVSPLRRAAKRKMQEEEQKKEGTSEVTQQEEEQPQSKEEEHNLKNGPSETSNVNEEKEKMENGLAAETDGSEKATEQDSEHLDEAPKAKPVSKDKKAKKSETPPKPKGKSSPKTTKDKKLESTEVKKSENTEVEVTEIEIETKDKKATKKAKESHNIVSDLIQPTVKILRLNPQMLAANANEMNDSSVVEIPLDDSEEKQDALPSTSSEWPTASRASPRRSTRLQEQKHVQDDSVIIVQKSEPDDSVLVLENESVSVTEVSRSSKTNVMSFAEALSGMTGRRSLRPLPPLNLASRQQQHRLPPVMTSTPDPQELKTRSFSSVVHKSSKSVMTTNDLDDAANNSCSTEESGTSSELSALAPDLNTSGKRKISSIQVMDEVEQEHKRFRSITDEQLNSTGFLSMISSPMNAFASRIKSGKSSTPVNLVKVSPLAEEDAGHLTEDVSDIVKEQTDQSLDLFIEKKENVVVESSHSEVPQKKWCSVM